MTTVTMARMIVDLNACALLLVNLGQGGLGGVR